MELQRLNIRTTETKSSDAAKTTKQMKDLDLRGTEFYVTQQTPLQQRHIRSRRRAGNN
jgi:hypothetical protein